MATLDEMLRTADFVSLHAKVTDETSLLISAQQLALMRSTAFLINTARGALVDQRALCKALNSNQIAGAALDVLESELTSAGDPLRQLDNDSLTPHIGGASREVTTHHFKMVLEDISLYIEGKRPKHLVNPPTM